MQPQNTASPVCLQSHGREFVELLGKSHTLDMLYFLFNSEDPVRFNQLKREMEITATTLSRRLDEFIEHNLVTREVYAEVPARVEYELSDKGRSLGPVLESLFGWVEEAYS
jgi:DNA-binding HxlR family transcriptional regulator